MDPKKKPKRKSCSYRISADVDAQLREFIRHWRGHPLFLELGAFVEEAIRRHIAATKLKLEGLNVGGGNVEKPEPRLNHTKPDSWLPAGITIVRKAGE